MRFVGLIGLLVILATAAGAAEVGSPADRSRGAAELMQRGVQYAARGDYKDALPELQKACGLMPSEPDCFYDLGYVQMHSSHPDLALQSFTKALALKPNDIQALLARAQLRYKDRAAAKQDLDVIDGTVEPDDDVRLELGATYETIGDLPAAIHQLDLWLAHHYDASDRVLALDARCRAQAEANQNLDQALSDCNEALRQPDTGAYDASNGGFIHPHMRGNPDILAARGLVWLRRGDFDRAIKDYDDAVEGRPKTAEYRFARGLAELRAGRQAKGRADIAAATAMQKDVADRFAAWGLTP
jgi:tetratricopeptide (TPR) repeat protein